MFLLICQPFAYQIVAYEAANDDGLSIPAISHKRTFQMFHTLQPRDKIEDSGMDLIVAKASSLAQIGKA